MAASIEKSGPLPRRLLAPGAARRQSAGPAVTTAIRAKLGARKGFPMATYFIFGAIGTCPGCGDHRFSGPISIAPDTSVTCHRCGQVTTVAEAAQTGLASGAVKKLSDHRVVQDP
jgi:hypothetical protein